MFALSSLPLPIVQVPMAGGVATPQLAAAVSNAGGLGSIAGGYLGADQFRELLATTGNLTTQFNANIFVPEAHHPQAADLKAYAAALTPLAQELGLAAPQVPEFHDDAYHNKLELLAEYRPAVATFTFGLPKAEELELLNNEGILTGVTITSVAEAQAAINNGAQFLIAQGYEAGGHLSVHNQFDPPPGQSLDELITAMNAVITAPIVAAGGIATPERALEIRNRGAQAVSLGTRFLTCHEAGTNPVHKHAILYEEYSDTVLTRAFTGRMARGLANEFIERMHPVEVVGYPQVHYMTSPIRKAQKTNAKMLNLWAGTGFRHCKEQSAAELIAEFEPFLN